MVQFDTNEVLNKDKELPPHPKNKGCELAEEYYAQIEDEQKLSPPIMGSGNQICPQWGHRP
jgi:hypothetical protein